MTSVEKLLSGQKLLKHSFAFNSFHTTGHYIAALTKWLPTGVAISRGGHLRRNNCEPSETL